MLLNLEWYMAPSRLSRMSHAGVEDTDVVMHSPTGLDPPTVTKATSSHARWDPRIVAHSLCGADAKLHFAQNIFDIYKFWLQLVHSTTLSRNMTSLDAGVLSAFQAIDAVIEGGANRLARLAYARLPPVMSALHSIISVDRKQGRIHSTVGYRNASVALDIYVSAQRKNTDATRRKLVKRSRLATRWAHLGGSYPLLMVSHPEVVDQIV